MNARKGEADIMRADTAEAILSGARVPASQVGGRGYLLLLRECLSLCQPRFGDLPVFQTIDEYVRELVRDDPAYGKFLTDNKSKLAFATAGIGLETQCVKLGHVITSQCGEQGPCVVMTYQDLLLSRKGELLLCEMQYLWGERVRPLERRKGLYESANFIMFTALEDDKLITLLGRKLKGEDYLGLSALLTLRQIAAEDVRRKSAELNRSRQLARALAKRVKRVSSD